MNNVTIYQPAPRTHPGRELLGSLARRPATWAALITLLGFGLRVWALESFPPGWRDDELIESLVISRNILGGDLAFYYPDASGHEALYHALNALFLAWFGPTQPGIRLLSGFLGTLAVPLTYALGRRLFGAAVGLSAAALLAVSFWGLMYSRVGIRHSLTPVLALAAFFWFWQGMKGRKGEREKGSTSTPLLPFSLSPLLPFSRSPVRHDRRRHFLHIPYCRPKPADRVGRGGEGQHAVGWDAAEGGLEADDAAERRRANDRADGLRAQRRRAVPGGHGRRRAAAAAARRAQFAQGRAQRVARGAGGEVGELGRHGLAQDERAGRPQRRHAGGFRPGEERRRQRRSCLRGKAVDIEDVLDADDRAEQRRPRRRVREAPIEHSPLVPQAVEAAVLRQQGQHFRLAPGDEGLQPVDVLGGGDAVHGVCLSQRREEAREDRPTADRRQSMGRAADRPACL